jgi:hypothetical protein
MSLQRCFENRTFHTYTNANPRCCNESSDYIQKVKFSAIMNENCKNVTSATNGISGSEIARKFGIKYSNYQVRNDAYDISCNRIKT